MRVRRNNRFVFCVLLVSLLIATAFVVVILYVRQDQASAVLPLANQAQDASDAADGTHATENIHGRFPRRLAKQAWFEVSGEALSGIENDSERPKNSVYVRTNADYSEWLLGTPIELYIPQTNTTHFAVVDRIKADGSGNATVYAIPDETEENFERLVLTYSEESTMAYISIKTGSYELTAAGGIGLLVPKSSLTIARDPTISDVGNSTENRYADAEYLPRRSE